MQVHVHANCQGPAIAALLQEAFPAWQISAYEVFGSTIIDEFDTYRRLIETSDVVVSQPIHDDYRNRPELGLSWVRASVKPGGVLVVVPSMFFDGQLIGQRGLSIPSCDIPYQNILFVHMLAHGAEDDRIAEVLLAPELLPEGFIAQEIVLSIEEMRTRETDEQIDVGMSDYLQNTCWSRQTFHVINHPFRDALVHVAQGVVRALGIAGDIRPQGPELLRLPHVPLLPSVARFLRDSPMVPEGWETGDLELYHLPAGKLDHRAYLAKAASELRSRGPDALIDCLRHPYVSPFLARASAAQLAVPYIDEWAGYDRTPARIGRR